MQWRKKVCCDCLHLHFIAAGYYRVLANLQTPNFAQVWIVLTDCRKPDSDRKSRTEHSLLLRRTGVICWRHWISVPHLTATFILYLWSWIKWKCCLLGYIVYMICSNTTESSRAQNFFWWAGQCMQPLLLFWSTPDTRKHLLLQNLNQPQLKFLRRLKEKCHKKRRAGN